EEQADDNKGELRSHKCSLPRLLAKPLIQAIAGRNLALDVDGNRLAFPMLDQLRLAEISIQELFRKLDTLIIEQLNILLQTAIDGHRDFPGRREDLRIFDGHFVTEGIGRDRG